MPLIQALLYVLLVMLVSINTLLKTDVFKILLIVLMSLIMVTILLLVLGMPKKLFVLNVIQDTTLMKELLPKPVLSIPLKEV